MKVCETERLVLRPFTMDDLDAIHRVVYSDPEVCRLFCGRTQQLGFRLEKDQHPDWPGVIGILDNTFLEKPTC